MALEKILRRITLLFMAILLMNCIILVKGKKNLRKEESSNENADNYIIIYIDSPISYGGFNEFNRGKRDMVSYVKYLDTEVHKDSDNKFPPFTVDNKDNPEITFPIPLEIHFSSCVSSLGEFFDCELGPNSDGNSYNFIEVDFSHFDSSCFKSTKKLFYFCSSLTKINFSNLIQKNLKICLICLVIAVD